MYLEWRHFECSVYIQIQIQIVYIFENVTASVNVNNSKIDCLMYADDIVILSETQEGLQQRMNLLHTYCSKWCLNVNLCSVRPGTGQLGPKTTRTVTTRTVMQDMSDRDTRQIGP